MKYLKIPILAIALLLSGCSDFLEEQVFTEYDPEAFLASEAGINAVLTATYSQSWPNYRETWFSFAGWPTDLQLERGGGYAAPAATFANFQWQASNAFFRNNWQSIYAAIRNANSLLDNIDNVTSISRERVASLKAEATYLRAFNYYILYDLFGPVPLITSANDLNFEPRRASDDEVRSFIETELQSAVADLPVNAELSGKATKGAAMALLGRFYLNTKQWQKCADILDDVITLGKYKLFTPVEGLFSIENEGNDELIFVFESLATGPGWNYMPHAYPVGYPTDQVNYGAQFQLWRTFVDSFHPDDRRALDYDPDNGKYGWILKNYTDKSGNYIDLMNDEIIPGIEKKYPRSFKFSPDPNALGAVHGNDIPILRYAEVLISRAEALNELEGPNQTSIDLLNEVRTRAEAPLYELSEFPTKESLRDQILVERGWEFFTEGLRRQDLIRHGKFISSAQERGKTLAQPFHVLYPLPQAELDANPALEQNQGY
ncbi:MAG: RagB/SusD family nutrient uptake outer membrane protein [Saprospiraceae bacterium]|nr:RagB/SusD family nutrient uptake outer membrane protein [Lewinella sp.]